MTSDLIGKIIVAEVFFAGIWFHANPGAGEHVAFLVVERTMWSRFMTDKGVLYLDGDFESAPNVVVL